MSELISIKTGKVNSRWQLLATASAVALLGWMGLVETAQANDGERPQVWIELGGQLSKLDEGETPFAQSFPVERPSIFSPSGPFERLPRYSVDWSGDLSFRPDDSGWTFSASVRYGRSVSNKHIRQQTSPHVVISNPATGGTVQKYPFSSRFADTQVTNEETHVVVDFQAGKDVGLGVFGRHGSSVLSAGIRFAQFTSKSNIALKSDPDWHFTYVTFSGVRLAPFQAYHTNQANLLASRSFHGVGPALSWSATAPLVSTSADSDVVLDLGVNAALLFGRQRARVHHDALAQYHPGGKYYNNAGYRRVTYNPAPANLSRSRSVTVPNVGGFAGLSFRYANAKISAGYRADFFFGAMDGGIDSAKKEDAGFYGPFATISIGLGG